MVNGWGDVMVIRRDCAVNTKKCNVRSSGSWVVVLDHSIKAMV